MSGIVERVVVAVVGIISGISEADASLNISKSISGVELSEVKFANLMNGFISNFKIFKGFNGFLTIKGYGFHFEYFSLFSS